VKTVKTRNYLLSIATILLVINILNSSVNLKNGNFFISYSDVDFSYYKSSFETITRTYNSKATNIGLFGFGWGSPLDTKLKSYPDGFIVIQENGTGSNSFYSPDFVEDDWLDEMIDVLIETDIKSGKIKNNPSAIIKRKEAYTNLHDRLSAWDKYVKKGELSYKKDFPKSMSWEGTNMGETKNIIITSNGYKRINSLNTFEEFNIDGQLTFFQRDKFKFATLEYKNGVISMLINADKTILTFKTNKKGYVTEINFEGVNAIYKYDIDDLIFSENVDGSQYEYEYDKLHNLTKIVNNPSRSENEIENAYIIKYHPVNSFVAEVIDRDGNHKRYDYTLFYNEDGSKNKNRYGTTVTKIGIDDNKEYTNYYEWEIRTRANGSTYSYKIIEIENDFKTETTMDEVCSEMPIEIKRGNFITKYEYNNRCLRTKESNSSGLNIEMKYHPTSEKLVEVLKGDDLFKYDYNENYDLITAQKNNNLPIKFTYDEKGKIETFTTDAIALTFEYNTIGKPIKISIKGKGHISMDYDEYGEVKNVDSEGGREIPSLISDAFQVLLNVVSPSGINLGF
jgi:YD repeat-containing protein